MRGISSKAKTYQRRQQRLKALCVQAGLDWPLRLVFVTGAGVSAASGIPTFRGPNGLWTQAELQRFSHSSILKKDLAGFLAFHNARRQQILASEPTLAHRLIAALQAKAQVSLITQNIDDLHERAGSQDVWHLHGSIQHTVPIGFRGDKYRKAWQGNIQLGITSIRPFRKYNLLTALCATDWWLRRQGFELTTLVDDDLQAVIERVIRGYRMPTVWECEQFSQEFRYWFFMHSQPISGQPEGAISVIKTMSRNLKAIDW